MTATPTLISISASQCALTYGSVVDFTASVTTNPPSSIYPTGGTVTFQSGATTLGTAPLFNGEASLWKILGAGTYSVTASYGGTPTFGASVSTTSAGYIFAEAGTGTYGSSGDGGAATAAELSNPFGVAVDSCGNIYIADTFDDVIRKVTATTGIITTIAGMSGNNGYTGDGGPATSAELYDPRGLALDAPLNLLFIADRDNSVIRELNLTTGIITTVAGTGTYGDGGTAIAATTCELANPTAVAVDSSGKYLYIADTFNDMIREVNLKTGIITTVAGTGTAGFSGDNGPATCAELYDPSGLAVSCTGALYIADSDNQVVRVVNPRSHFISTIAGTPETSGFSGDNGPAKCATLFTPWGLALNSSGTDLYIADRDNNAIREVNLITGIITTIAGTGGFGPTGDGGPALAAELSSPRSVAVDASGNVYIADTLGNEVRLVAAGSATADVTVAGCPLLISVSAASRTLGTPNPTFSITYLGFVNNDTVASLTTPPMATTTATATSPVGAYPIAVGGASSPNYIITYNDSLLSVVPAVSPVAHGARVSGKSSTAKGKKAAAAVVFSLARRPRVAAAANPVHDTLETATVKKGKKKIVGQAMNARFESAFP